MAPAEIPYTFDNKSNAAAALSTYQEARMNQRMVYVELAAQAAKLASNSPAFFAAINTIHRNPLSKVWTILFQITCAQFQLELEEAYSNCQASSSNSSGTHRQNAPMTVIVTSPCLLQLQCIHLSTLPITDMSHC